MQTVINNLLTSYKTYGKGNVQTLVILHGWGRDMSDWEKVAINLSDKHKVILVDLPGFGGTVKPKNVYGVSDYTKFVESFLVKLGINKYNLLGHSFGGRIGIMIATTSKKLDKLILVDSAGLERPSFLNKLFLNIAKKFIKFAPNFVVTKAKKVLGSADYQKAGEMENIFVKVVNEDLFSKLSKIKNKTLIVWGSHDKILNVNTTKKFKKNISNSIVRIVWTAGHHPHLDKQGEFLKIVKDFLND